MTSNFEAIPVIDFELLNSDKPKFLSNLKNAILNVGFLYVKNTGIAQHEIDGLKKLLPSLFSTTDEEKADIELEKSPHFLGYSAVGSETTAGQTDLREQFEFTSCQDNVWQPGQPMYQRLTGPNQYPRIAGAREIIETYMQACTEFAENFLKLVAEALEVPADKFLSFSSGANRLKIVRYPEISRGTSQGVGPHKDSSGWWTFLLQASSPEVKGLQVLNKAGQWIDVPNLPDTLVVNIGQAFEVLTLGACKATTHRVLGGSRERYSVPFFLGVRGDLTKTEALTSLAQYFPEQSEESSEGSNIDSAFLRGNYNTWGESQLRTKIRSHRKAGQAFYPELFEEYIAER